MNAYWVTGVVLSEAISVFLFFKLLRKKEHLVLKSALAVMLLVPFLGPLIYFFLTEETPRQHPDMMDRGPRGDWTHHWIGLDPIFRAIIEERTTKLTVAAEQDGDGQSKEAKEGAQVKSGP